MRTALLGCVLGGMLLVGNGCALLCGPCNPCGPGVACGEPCGPCAGPACRPFGGLLANLACGPVPCGPVACGPAACATPCADCPPCGAGACGPCRPAGPFALIVGLFTHDTWGNCGCGERYWGEFSDRPDCHDPCDCHGNYVGGGPVGPVGPAGPMAPSAPVMGAPAPGGCATCGSVGRATPPRSPAMGQPAYVQGQPVRAPQRVQSAYRVQGGRPVTGSPSARPPAATMANSPYATRIISETDQVVVPATPAQQPTQARRTTMQR